MWIYNPFNSHNFNNCHHQSFRFYQPQLFKDTQSHQPKMGEKFVECRQHQLENNTSSCQHLIFNMILKIMNFNKGLSATDRHLSKIPIKMLVKNNPKLNFFLMA